MRPRVKPLNAPKTKKMSPLPTPPNNPEVPIPNDPFYAPPTNRLEGGDQGVVTIGAGLTVTPDGVLNATGLGPVAAVTYLAAGTGLAVDNNTGNVLITNTGVVTLSAGPGIAISGSNGNFTVTNTLPATPTSGTVFQVDTGVGLSGGPITGSGTIALTNTGVGPGTYTNPTITVDAQGRISFATNGSPGSLISGTYPIQVTGGILVSIADASTSSPGAVQLENSVSSTSVTKAATPSSVKTAYDTAQAAQTLANNAQAAANSALPKAGGTMTGLITFAPGQTFPGTAGVTQILAGTNITVTPAGGIGVVTIDATGGAAPVPATPTVEGIVFGCTLGWSTALGENALLGNTGQCNTAIGCDALCNSNSGRENTAVGHISLRNNQTGRSNTAVGQKAMLANDSGSNNVAVGVNALFSNSTGGWNTGVGLNALYYSDTGCYNTSVGWQSGIGSDTGSYNTSVGTCTLANISGFSGNTAFGSNSLDSISGSYNTAIGYCSGSAQTSGDCNVLIGYGATAVSLTGSCQLAIGFSATDNWLTGDSTKAIKPGAGIIDCSGSCGTTGQVLSSNGSNAIEWVAGGGGATPATPTVEGIVYGCTDSTNFNYGLGDGILGALTTGTLNIAIGTGALATTDSGTSNTAVGIGALFGNTSGTQNVALGQQALFSATTAGLNTAIGSQALQNTTGDANTALGNFAGNVLTTGCSNILIGNQAGGAGAGALDTGNNNVVIGNCVSVVSNSGDCQLAIGVNTICWLTGTSTGAIKPGAGIIDCANSCGTAGQVLMSNGSNRVCWGTAASPAIASQTTRGIVYGRSASSGITDDNVAFGYNALGGLSNNSSRNVAMGKDALSSINSFDNDNTAVGYTAFPSLTTGNGNTALGSGGFFGIGATLVSGSCNVVIGCGADVSSSSVNNEVTISSGTGSQRFTGAGNWAAVSDVRDKADIQDLALGLEFLKEVKPRQFAWDMRHTGANKGERTSGFVAQEVQKIVEKFDAVEYAKLVDTANENQWMLSQTQFVPILVKAIQELSAKVEALEAKLAANG